MIHKIRQQIFSKKKLGKVKNSLIFFNSKKSKKFQLPLDECNQLQLGAIRTHMYQIKSTQGEKTLKTGVKLTQVKKIRFRKLKTPISHST